jgi:hypothetical protein
MQNTCRFGLMARGGALAEISAASGGQARRIRLADGVPTLAHAGLAEQIDGMALNRDVGDTYVIQFSTWS